MTSLNQSIAGRLIYEVSKFRLFPEREIICDYYNDNGIKTVTDQSAVLIAQYVPTTWRWSYLPGHYPEFDHPLDMMYQWYSQRYPNRRHR